MIEHSAAYDAAITGSSRKQVVQAIFDLIDPDAIMEGTASNDESLYSLTHQIIERGNEETEQNIASLEANRWLLNGTFNIEPADKTQRVGHVGWESGSLCDAEGVFADPQPYVEILVSGVEVLQALTVGFSQKNFNGLPRDFTIQIYSDTTFVEEKTVTGNTETRIGFEDFNANYPTRIRLIVHRWSLPHRRVRLLNFYLGLYERWSTKNIRSIDIYSEVTFSGLALPYSSCTITVYNENHRFDPYAPNSIFRSIEARQAIKVDMGVLLENGETEWLPAGTYFQQSGGWTLQDLTITWKLVDMIGMLVKRKFIVPATLPTTLGGWLEAIASSLGVNFRDKYVVDDDVAGIALSATQDGVDGKMCGEILRFACMATNTWPRQDIASGNVRVGKLERVEGNRITLDNMVSYPTMEANDDIADITFTLDEGSITFPGTNTDSDVSLQVNNPFVHTAEDARIAAISCFFEYGGKYFQVMHRGNPSSEPGDLQTVDTQFLTTISARLYKQQLKLEDGVMRNMPSHLVQSPNDSVYTNKVVLTGSGTWTAPSVQTTIKVTVIGGGTGGRGGGGGFYLYGKFDPPNTVGSTGGDGGKVFITEIQTNAGQVYTYSCGHGGAAGEAGGIGQDGGLGGAGGATTFGVLSSENGRLYPNGLMDIQSGAVYAQRGADSGGTVSGTYGTGGAGGHSGVYGRMIGIEDEEGYTTWYPATHPTAGTSGQPGKDGCVIVEW